MTRVSSLFHFLRSEAGEGRANCAQTGDMSRIKDAKGPLQLSVIASRCNDAPK